MYSQEITYAQLDKASKILGFKFVKHSPDEVDTNNDHFASLVDEKGKLTRKLTGEEDRYIQNERTLCRWDYYYWLTRYHKILTWEGNRIIHMKPNIAQSIVLDAVADMEKKAIAIKIQNLKARQLGITTEGIARVGHRVQFHPNVKAIVGSADPSKSEKMFNKMVLSWQNQPWFLMPGITAQRVGELIEFGGIGSSLSVQHGNQASWIS